MVIMAIRESSHSDALRTYHSSNFSFSSLVTSLAPLTWAHPLIPGRTESLIDVFAGWSSGSRGRGPIMDISPNSTFNSCGNSSRRVVRRNRPTAEGRLLPAVGCPVESTDPSGQVVPARKKWVALRLTELTRL